MQDCGCDSRSCLILQTCQMLREGALRKFDEEAMVPSLQQGHLWVSYDDQVSVALKVTNLLSHSGGQPIVHLSFFSLPFLFSFSIALPRSTETRVDETMASSTNVRAARLRKISGIEPYEVRPVKVTCAIIQTKHDVQAGKRNGVGSRYNGEVANR